MKYLTFGVFITGMALFGCHSKEKSQTSIAPKDTTKEIKQSVPGNSGADSAEIQSLVRNMLVWSDSKNSIQLVPAITNGKDSVYTGLDLNQLHANLETLKATVFFLPNFLITTARSS